MKTRFLELNVGKTKELILGKLKGLEYATPVVIDQKEVEIVHDFKYLGTHVDEKLSFDSHADSVYKKSQQRLFLLRKLKSFDVSQPVLELVYRSLIESVLSFNIITWFNFLTVKQRTKLGRVVNIASKIIGQKQQQLPSLYRTAVSRKSYQIVNDRTHPLHSSFQKLPSGRRFRVPLARKNILKKSFVPSAVSVLNASL